MATPQEIQSSAGTRAAIGTVLTIIGAAVIGSAAQDADVALGGLLIGVGQFLVLRGLITWSVSRGTEPLAEHLRMTHALMLDLVRQGAAGSPSPSPTTPQGGIEPPPSTVLPDWTSEADRRECTNNKCTAGGIRISAYRCPACQRPTMPIQPRV